MSSYIDAHRFKSWLEEQVKLKVVSIASAEGTASLLEYAPTADVQEVKHGKWIKINGAVWFPYSCSVCGDEADTNEYQYCHNGHKMDL